jgi:hypothetical protein
LLDSNRVNQLAN